MQESTTLVGHLTEVQGSSLIAHLLDDEQQGSPTVTIGDEDILVGQVGSYVSIRQAGVEILGLVTKMSEQERSTAPEAGAEAVHIPFARRMITVIPLGTVDAERKFERGVSRYPTTGAEVHVLASSELAGMFQKFRSSQFEVGTISSNPKLSLCLDPTALFGRHFAILGQTGAGKSFSVASLLQKAVSLMPSAHVIILDIHGEYFWVREDGAKEMAFPTGAARHIDARDLELPYWLMTYAELSDLLIDRTEQSAHNQTAVFRDALNALRKAEGQKLGLKRTTVDTPVYFDLASLRSVVETKNAQIVSPSTGKLINGPLTGAFDNFLMRLDSRLNDVRYDFLLKPKKRTKSDTLVSLLRDFVGLSEPKSPITIIDLSGVPFDVRPTVAAQIGRLAFEFNYWNPKYREFPILLICEEAHAYIPRESQSQFAGSRRSMERIAKEGRKYGVGLGVVSQRPHEVSETVLAQCGTFLCLRITNPDDQAYVRSLVPEAERDLVDILAGLGRGEVMGVGEAVPLPTRFQMYRPNPEPNSNDIDFYTKWKMGMESLDVAAIVKRWRDQERS